MLESQFEGQGQHRFLAGGGELAKLIAAFDWKATSLGNISNWPLNLRLTLGLILRSPVPIVTLWGKDGVMIYNDAYSVFAGGRHPQLLGSRVRDGWPEVADFNDNVMKVVLAGGVLVYKDQSLVLERNGQPEQVWMNLDYSPILDETGEPAGVIAVVVETTEKVLADRWLKGEQERLRQMFEQAPGFIAMLRGPEHVFDLVNPAYLQLVGHRDILGKAVRTALPEVAGQRFFELLDEVYDSGKTFSGTSMPISLRRTPDAAIEERCIDLVYQPIKNPAGQIIGIFAQGTDVTERLQAEESVRESEATFQTFAQAMPNHAWTAQADGLLNWFNDRVYEYSGASLGELDGQAWASIVHPDDLAIAAAHWEAALISQKSYENEFRIRRADGAYRWHIVRALPIRNAAGSIVRWIGTNTDIHERKLAEAESTRDRDRIWALSQELMLVCDFEGLIKTVNPHATRMLGWGEEEFVGRTLLEFIHPDDVASTMAEVAKLSQGVATLVFDNRYRTKSGEYRLINWTGVPDAGRIHAIGRDVTEERALAKDRERIWNLSPVLKVVGTLSGEILSVNPSWTRALGWSAEETIGHNVMEFVAPEDRGVGISGMEPLAGGTPVVEYQNTFITKAGARRRISWTTVPENGTLYGFGRDVTAEIQAADALAASMAERERIWNSTNDLMGTAGLDGFLKSINPAWKRLLAYDNEELLSRPFLDFIDSTDKAKFIEVVRRLSTGQAVHDIEDKLIHRDGKRSLIAWSAEPLGDIFYIVGRNVTEQRTAEEALRQSQKMEAVGQLTGGIAHDFNNLIQSITGSLDLVQKRITQGRIGELDRFINGAMQAANRASSLTHRLLAFSRRQPLDPRPVRANPLIISMEDLLRRTMGERIELELVLAGGLWLTLCDPNQLENAVLNLAIIRDAMPSGGKLIIETCNAHLDSAYMTRHHDVKPGQYVCICVTDTGTGMSADTISRAFEPFFTTKPIGHGTGLGLSMIYGFARQSEGHAKIYSELAKGTTVKLYLPRYWNEIDEKETAAETASSLLVETGETVLVVEDEPVVRGLIVEVLSDLGYHPLEAADGPSGLAILQSHKRIDLLITDIGLPGLNGRQVADAGRALRPNLKVLFMTGYAENAAFASGFLEHGMTMITKPFAMEALATRIRTIIEED